MSADSSTTVDQWLAERCEGGCLGSDCPFELYHKRLGRPGSISWHAPLRSLYLALAAHTMSPARYEALESKAVTTRVKGCQRSHEAQ